MSSIFFVIVVRQQGLYYNHLKRVQILLKALKGVKALWCLSEMVSFFNALLMLKNVKDILIWILTEHSRTSTWEVMDILRGSIKKPFGNLS